MDDPVAWFKGEEVSKGNLFHLRTNHQGSIVLAAPADDSVGNNYYITAQYDEWGNWDDSAGLRFGYTGQIWIKELGLWHYKARMYSPKFGRFMQTDPVGYQDQFNMYAYGRNDPMSTTDPSGKIVWMPIIVAAVAVGVSVGLDYRAAKKAGKPMNWSDALINGVVAGGSTLATGGWGLLLGASLSIAGEGVKAWKNGTSFSEFAKTAGAAALGSVIGGSASGLKISKLGSIATVSASLGKAGFNNAHVSALGRSLGSTLARNAAKATVSTTTGSLLAPEIVKAEEATYVSYQEQKNDLNYRMNEVQQDYSRWENWLREGNTPPF